MLSLRSVSDVSVPVVSALSAEEDARAVAVIEAARANAAITLTILLNIFLLIRCLGAVFAPLSFLMENKTYRSAKAVPYFLAV